MVIVAKADDGVVVRHLSEGREEIVDLDELEPIEGGAYLQASEIVEETVNLVVRVDREDESASVAAFRSIDEVDTVLNDWVRSEEQPGSEYTAVLTHAEGDVFIFRAEALLED